MIGALCKLSIYVLGFCLKLRFKRVAPKVGEKGVALRVGAKVSLISPLAI